MTIDRTSIVFYLVKIGNLINYNFYLSKFVENIIKKYKIKVESLRTIVDEITIEIDKYSKTYEKI